MTKQELKGKYQEQINQISETKGVDTGVALDMLIAGARNHGKADYPQYLDGIDVDINELQADVQGYIDSIPE